MTPASRTASFKAAAVAVAIVGTYLFAAGVTFRTGLPLRPVYDGTAPPKAYQWVKPPAGQEKDNVKPEPATGRIGMDAKGVKDGTIATPDGQFVVTIHPGSIPAKAGQNSVKIDVTPLDPETIGKAPDGLSYDGNAYKVDAVYLPSNQPASLTAAECPADAQPKACATIVMRYAFGATGMYVRTGRSWTAIDGAQPVPSSLQIFADSATLGTFVPAGPFSHAPAGTNSTRTYLIVLISTVVIAAAAGFTRRASLKQWLKRKQRKKAPPKPMKKR